jgi:mycobactin polyketide synthetase MbtD
MSPLSENAGVVAFDSSRARSVLEACGRGALLAPVNSPDPESRYPLAESDASRWLTTLVAGAVGVDRVDTIDTTVPMVALGLDSLQALELRRRIKIGCNHDVEVADLLGGASIDDVIERIGTRRSSP